MSKKKNNFDNSLELYYRKMEDYLSGFAKLSADEKEELPSLFKPVFFKRYEHFLHEGDVCSSVAFVAKGIFRYYQTKDGAEITNDFSFDNSFLTGYVSLITRTPSDISIQALEDAHLLVISYEKLYRKYDENHSFERLGRLMAEQIFMLTRTHMLNLLNENAENRYQKLIEKSPHLVQHIPLHYIASYLGITPETLSRIRKKLAIS